MGLTVEWSLWCEYTFPVSTTVVNTRLVSSFLGSIEIGTCVDIDFFLAWIKCPCTVAIDLVKYLLTNFGFNLIHYWKIHYILPLFMWITQGWKLQRESNVSVLGVKNFYEHYYFVLYVSVMVIPLVVQWVGFSIICCFCLLGPGWLFFPCVWLLLLVLWTHMCIQHHIVFQWIQVIYVWYWAWCGPHMLTQVSLGNIVDMARLISWFVHLGIPHFYLYFLGFD